jgi:hypothetical protein
MGAAMVLAVVGVFSVASAAGNTLRLDPATASVAKDGTFTVKVIQNASVATSGSSATITFDKKIVQVTSVTRGAPFATAPLFLAGDAAAIAAANKNGKLKNVAAAFFPPASVPTGDQEFLTVGFKAIGCGTVKMTLPAGASDATILDGRAATYGVTLKITTAGATITVCDGAAGGSTAPGASSDASIDPNASVDPNASIDPNASVDPNASASAAPVPSDSSQPGASAGPSAAPSGLVAAPGDGSGSGGTSAAQSDWLTFSMGALAVAAAGLATLILVLTLAAIVAAVVGGVFLIRLWRRTAPRDEIGVTTTTVLTDVPETSSAGATGATQAIDDALAPEARPRAASPTFTQPAS